MLDKDGNETTLSAHEGRPVVVNFWATWCGPCQSELPAFENAWAAWGDRVDFMMVNLTDGNRDTVDGVKAFVEKGGYTFPVYFDTAYSAANAYGVMAIPTTVFINADGTLAQQVVGALREETLTGALADLTAE